VTIHDGSGLIGVRNMAWRFSDQSIRERAGHIQRDLAWPRGRRDPASTGRPWHTPLWKLPLSRDQYPSSESCTQRTSKRPARRPRWRWRSTDTLRQLILADDTRLARPDGHRRKQTGTCAGRAACSPFERSWHAKLPLHRSPRYNRIGARPSKKRLIEVLQTVCQATSKVTP